MRKNKQMSKSNTWYDAIIKYTQLLWQSSDVVLEVGLGYINARYDGHKAQSLIQKFDAR